jgi:branched-subunit amino acid ABC-type transport system permease component
MDLVAESVVIGLVEQAPLILASIGFALIYRLTGLINVAYAETLTLGAYFAIWLTETFRLDFYAVLIPTAILSGLLSVSTYLLIFRPAKRRAVGVLEMIIISFGLSIVLRHGLQFIFGYPTIFFDVPPPDTIPVLGVGVTSFRLVALLTVGLLALLLYLFIQRTDYGLQVRALASDEQLAKVSGIRPLVVTVMIWFLAGVAGGLAGAFLGVGSSVSPLLGWRQFLFILMVVLVGVRWGIGGVILVGVAASIALTAMALSFDQILYAQLVLIVAFVILLKWRGRRLTEMAKV